MEAGQENTVAIVAIAVSGGVSLFVAVLAAIGAHWRQGKALTEERTRLELQLAHDRQLADLDGVRQLFDDCLE